MLSIDSNPVYTNAGNYNFDTISLHVSGPFWRPNTLGFYDDFSMSAEETVPEPASVLLCCPILAAGVLLRRRVRRRRG